MIDKTLEKLGLKDEEIKTFLYLLENGEQTAGNLAKKTGLSRPSLYGFLKKLQSNGLVVESQKNGIKTFLTCKEEQIKSILDEKIKELEKGKSEINNLFRQLQKGNLTTSPKFQFFEGKEGVSHTLKDILLYRNLETKTYWPIKAMIEILGEEFFKHLNKERIKRNIYNKAIWPQGQQVNIKTHPYLGVGENFLREIRLAPKEVEFSMGYWIYENKVAFISSKKECFGFIIESKEFVEMLSSQFEMIWKVSKTIHVSEEYTKKFLDKI
ncbi:MAG: helix-turn-helix domain-containing protein [Candidatus Paceibacterota bacterium]|jgi:sugar-specific transcriptional regulator TrmB